MIPRIPPATLRLIVLVSCAHALVHTYEQALPGVEQAIAREYFPDDALAGKRMTGQLSNYWRLCWGAGALVAGWLVDRFGARPMLAIYLLGCGTMCGASAQSTESFWLFASMIGMGAMASIYHPAGLALISHETTEDNRTRALGVHGIFGSLGIGLAPLAAGKLLGIGLDWRGFYWLLAVPGIALGLVFVWQSIRNGRIAVTSAEPSHSATAPESSPQWRRYFLVTIVAALLGFIYSAQLSFLPRYLSSVRSSSDGLTAETSGNYLAGLTLWMGCIGQFVGGRWGRRGDWERQFTVAVFGNAPALLWMAFATGWQRVAAAGLFAFCHFLHQPVYSSLIARYTPRHRRSVCYGFAFAMSLGLGSFGARYAGNLLDDRLIYSGLAVVGLVAGCLTSMLMIRRE